MNLFKLSLATVAGLHLAFSPLSAQSNFSWNPISDYQITADNIIITPTHFQAFEIDNIQLKHFLFHLGNTPEQAAIIQLPNPAGDMEDFRIWETPMMEAGLAAQFPEIKTFTAVSVSDPTVTAKLDYTAYGFSAMIYGNDESYYIDPINYDGGSQYQVYKKSDLQHKNKQRSSCQVGTDEQMDEILNAGRIVPPTSASGTPQLRTNGSVRKTYRLALACTGEYAKAVTGSSYPLKFEVLSKMTTTMNRVNGIYERELSVNMVLISNNSDIVYTNPSTDPYIFNNNGYYLLDENQDNVQSVIGSSNYDIGHIFSTGGGGIATVGSVCYNSVKAQGVTGSPAPYGDPFDVDYVAHEMGHQFGANHTFNNCAGNENYSTAFEPGSGSTVMAYAGICGSTNDLQDNSSDYFHPASLDEISEHISYVTCGTSATGSGTISLPSYTSTYKIPTNTAFELTAPVATWAGGSSLYYAWDQFNNGQIQRDEPLGATATAAPIFRSYKNSTYNRTRSFPNTDSVHSNKYSFKGERTPTVARNVKTRVTVRGISSDGFGSFHTSSSQVTVNYINTGSAFAVTSPNTSSVTWATGTNQTVTWNVAGTSGAPISTASVNIYLSIDGGKTYPITLASGVANTGSATVTVPEETATTKARVKVKGADNVFYDVSNVNFRITGSPSGITDITLNESFDIYPNPAQDIIHIKPITDIKQYEVRIYNILGQVMHTGTYKNENASIDIAGFANAVYAIEVIDAASGDRGNFKFVKQ